MPCSRDGGVAVVFGDLMLAPPDGTRQTLVWRKPPNAGVRGATAKRRRDLEAIYLIGPWPTGFGGTTSLLTTRESTTGGPHSIQGRYGHPHTKPGDLMTELITMCPPGTIADPFTGSGSTLVAAKALGRRAVGVEIDERYCETAALRLSQDALPIGQEVTA